jgi:hypothetical protein
MISIFLVFLFLGVVPASWFFATIPLLSSSHFAKFKIALQFILPQQDDRPKAGNAIYWRCRTRNARLIMASCSNIIAGTIYARVSC